MEYFGVLLQGQHIDLQSLLGEMTLDELFVVC